MDSQKLNVVIKETPTLDEVPPILANPSAFVAMIIKEQAKQAQANTAQRQATEQAIDMMKRAALQVQAVDKTIRGPQRY